MSSLVTGVGLWLASLQQGSQKRDAQRYLDSSTTESVLAGLRDILLKSQHTVLDQEEIFNEYCVDGDDGQKYWTQTSLISLFAATRPGLAQVLSSEESRLLWRIFHFHAYHPFPPPVADSPVNFAAYERAVGLLAAQGSSILGMQNEETQGWPAHSEIRWYERQDTFENADFCRIIRSVGVGGFCLGDVMDVLVMGVPFGYFFAPSLTMVGPAARRLAAAAGTITTTTRTVTGRQLGVLVGLLSRVKTDGTIRALRCYSGDLNEGDGHREIGECMMERLGLGEGELSEADYSRVVDAVVFSLFTYLSL